MNDEPAHILVVDDDRRLRELLRKYLADSGFRVTTAESAEDARAKLGSLAFDLIVLDVMMPGENGLALTAALRPKTNIPILMLTAMGEAEDRIKDWRPAPTTICPSRSSHANWSCASRPSCAARHRRRPNAPPRSSSATTASIWDAKSCGAATRWCACPRAKRGC